MATSAFKSTTKRSSIGLGPPSNADASDSPNQTGLHRRSRSLSRFSERFLLTDSDELPAPRGRFVNTVRGSGFPEMSLDDLANDFFPLKDTDETGRESVRSSRRSSAISPSTEAASLRRGRSVSRQHGRVGAAKDISKGASDNISRRRRSVSVARYQFCDSGSDMYHSHKSRSHADEKTFNCWNHQRPSLHKPIDLNHQRVLRRSMSQKDLLKSNDGYSSHSSALTDDEARDAHSNRSGSERTIRAVYAQKKTDHPTGEGVKTGMYEVMRKELRHAVEEIKTELEQGIEKARHSVSVNGDCLQSNNSDILQDVAMIRKNYATKLEQSEKRKKELLAEMVAEEERGRELSKIVRELLPDPKNTALPEKPTRARKNNDRSRMSKRLTEEAEKYFDDFISNVEDTDISSFDGERSDGSSTLGGTKKSRDSKMHCGETETFQIPSKSTSVPVEMDGVILPWLQWETSNDGSPLLCKSKTDVPLTTHNNLHDAAQGASTAYNRSNCVISSCGSWSPGGDSPSVVSRDNVEIRFGEPENYVTKYVTSGPKERCFDMDEYLHLHQSEDGLFEVWRQRQRIHSGALLLCRTVT